MMLKVKVLKREIPVQVKPVQGERDHADKEAFRPQWKSDSYEREVEKCSGENALDDNVQL